MIKCFDLKLEDFSSMTLFLGKHKDINDSLVLRDAALTDQQRIAAIFHGLPESYNVVFD